MFVNWDKHDIEPRNWVGMKDGKLTLQLNLIIMGLRVWDWHNFVLKTTVRTSKLFGPRHFSSRLLKASLLLWKVKEMQKLHATSIWNFFCIRCMVVKVFCALIYQRKWKETLSRWQKRQELHNYYLPSMIDDFEKKVLCLQGLYTFINNFWTTRLWQNRLFYTFLQL